MKSKKAPVILSVLLIVLGAAFLLFYVGNRGEKVAVQDFRAEGKEHRVELQSEGFYPKEVIIKIGDKVTFTTTQGRTFWPASALHPTHTLYPEFDAREPVEPDQTWSFTFEQSGEWSYHDHLTPAFTGVIRVVNTSGGEDYTQNCERLQELTSEEKRACYRKLLEHAFEKGGAGLAFETLHNLYKTEPEYIVAGCHKQAHEIGDLAYGAYLKHKNLDLVDMPREAYTFCGGGFYHGFLEHYLRANPGIEYAKKFCEYLENRKPGIRALCYHGMGHGMLPDPPDPRTWGNPQAILDSVLKKCDTISADTVEVLECHEGAFNVLLDWMAIQQYGLTVREKDPLWFCREQTTPLRKEACYYEFGMRVHALANNDIEKIAELFIDQIQDDYMASVAMGSAVATVIEAHLTKDDFIDFMLACRNVKERLRASCTENVPYGVIYHGEPGREYVKALQLCISPELWDTEKEVCYKKLFSYMPTYWPEKRKEICQAFEEKYRGLCQ